MRFSVSALCASLLCLAVPVAASCPAPPDHSAAVSGLYEDIQAAGTQTEGLTLGQKLWTYWTDAPDDVAQALLDRGMGRRESYDYAGALSDFERLVEYCPDYAEGYNQRAFVHFLTGNYEAALPDLDRAYDLSPRHTGVLTGRAMTLLALGRQLDAQKDLRRALDLNPWLHERGLLEALGEEL